MAHDPAGQGREQVGGEQSRQRGLLVERARFEVCGEQPLDLGPPLLVSAARMPEKRRPFVRRLFERRMEQFVIRGHRSAVMRREILLEVVLSAPTL